MYIPAENSKFYNRVETDLYSEIENCLEKYLDDGYVVELGDFNSRTGVE